MQEESNRTMRTAVGVACAGGLFLVFIFQQANPAALVYSGGDPHVYFFINRTIRFLINDGLTVGVIWALFNRRSYVWLALYVQLFEAVFILVPYFALKVWFPSYNGPLISFLHRLVLNPVLLLLLIPALYYQERR